MRDESIAIPLEKHMPFMNIYERTGMQQGLLEGIEVTLRMRFGAEGPELMPELRQIRDHELLRKILHRIEAASSPDDLRQVWTRKRRPKAAKSV
jgi:hypothetical protein